MPTTHTHDLSPTLLGFLPATHTRDFSLPCSHMYQPALSRAKPSHTSVSYWSTLAILKSQWKLMDWLPRSCLSLHDSMFLQDMHSACWLLHISFLLALLLSPEDGGYRFLLNVIRLFNGPRGIISQNIRTLHNHCCWNLKSYIVWCECLL